MTVAALEAEAVGLADAAMEQLELAFHAFCSDDPELAWRAVAACRCRQAAADQLYTSALALLADGPRSPFAVRRTAALLHIIPRIRHIVSEVAAIARLTGAGTASLRRPPEADRALGLMKRTTVSRLRRGREAYARDSPELAGEVMAAAPELGVVSAPSFTVRRWRWRWRWRGAWSASRTMPPRSPSR